MFLTLRIKVFEKFHKKTSFSIDYYYKCHIFVMTNVIGELI